MAAPGMCFAHERVPRLLALTVIPAGRWPLPHFAFCDLERSRETLGEIVIFSSEKYLQMGPWALACEFQFRTKITS